ncbi:hypothetical protein CWM52_25515 [Raoultella sp. T31]|nr:hypothetical protein CWM52_25515 [Raoultella sp. T31]
MALRLPGLQARAVVLPGKGGYPAARERLPGGATLTGATGPCRRVVGQGGLSRGPGTAPRWRCAYRGYRPVPLCSRVARLRR